MWQNELPTLQSRKMTFQPVPVRLGSPHSFVMGVWVPCSHLDHTALRSHELSSLSLAEEGFFQVETLFGGFHIETRRGFMFVCLNCVCGTMHVRLHVPMCLHIQVDRCERPEVKHLFIKARSLP